MAAPVPAKRGVIIAVLNPPLDQPIGELHDTVVYKPEHSIGLLYLCHFGCALRAALVVSGPARGQMWADETADGEGFQPVRDDDGTALRFAQWYRRWLDDAEAQLSHGLYA
jgi:hypothetical protein